MSQHNHQMFPVEFLRHLVRHFNSVIKERLLVVTVNKLEIQFPRSTHSDKTVVVSLFTKLVEAFKSISDKYIRSKDIHTQVRLNIEDREEHYVIAISGVIYIPPGKILNLLSLILWYYIRYITGDKPGNTEKGTRINNDWKKEEKHLRFEINQSQRRMTVSREEGPCFICGEDAFKVNLWEYRIPGKSRTISMSTQVCNKHTTKLI